jgi:hypothetical protein
VIENIKKSNYERIKLAVSLAGISGIKKTVVNKIRPVQLKPRKYQTAKIHTTLRSGGQ